VRETDRQEGQVARQQAGPEQRQRPEGRAAPENCSARRRASARIQPTDRGHPSRPRSHSGGSAVRVAIDAGGQPVVGRAP
jgi:hypothetical protein